MIKNNKLNLNLTNKKVLPMVAFHEYPLFDDDNLAQQPLKQQMMLP